MEVRKMKKYGLFGLITLIVFMGLVFSINVLAGDTKVVGKSFFDSKNQNDYESVSTNYIPKFIDENSLVNSILFEASNQLWFAPGSIAKLQPSSIAGYDGVDMTIQAGISSENGGDTNIIGGPTTGTVGDRSGNVMVFSYGGDEGASNGNVYLQVRDDRGTLSAVDGNTTIGGSICNMTECWEFEDFLEASSQFEDIWVDSINSKGDLTIDSVDGDLVALDGVVLVSPKGYKYRIIVSDRGELKTESVWSSK